MIRECDEKFELLKKNLRTDGFVQFDSLWPLLKVIMHIRIAGRPLLVTSI